jgi:hypothetical protein
LRCSRWWNPHSGVLRTLPATSWSPKRSSPVEPLQLTHDVRAARSASSTAASTPGPPTTKQPPGHDTPSPPQLDQFRHGMSAWRNRRWLAPWHRRRGRRSARHRAAAACARPGSRPSRAATASSCRTCPNRKLRRNDPNIDGAYARANNRPMPPCRSRCMSSMLSAPATIPATNATTFNPGCAPRSVGTVNRASARSADPPAQPTQPPEPGPQPTRDSPRRGALTTATTYGRVAPVGCPSWRTGTDLQQARSSRHARASYLRHDHATKLRSSLLSG